MTHLNVPGAVLIPAPSKAKTSKKGRVTSGPAINDLHVGIRLLTLGFWATK